MKFVEVANIYKNSGLFSEVKDFWNLLHSFINEYLEISQDELRRKTFINNRYFICQVNKLRIVFKYTILDNNIIDADCIKIYTIK